MQSEGVEQVDEVKLYLPTGELVLASGKVVKPVSAPQPAAQMARDIKSGRQAAVALERIHRKLGDLPEQTEKMNAIACVLMYTGVGVSDSDIAVALKTSAENIARLKELDAYKQLAEMFDSTVFEDAKRTANHIISRATANAAQRIVNLVDDEDPNIALTAARDVAKFGGIGVDRASEGQINGLNIKIIRKSDKNDDDITVEINNA